MNYRRIGAFVIVIAVSSGCIYWFVNSPIYKLYRTEGFLDALWIEELQLYNEHPTAERVGLVPDNYLMNRFRDDQPKARDPDITPYLWQGRVEVLSGEVLSFPLSDVETVFVETRGEYDVYTERQGEILTNWNASADLLGYACLSYFNCEECHDNGAWGATYLWYFALLWDGQGFNDRDFAQEGQYAVYKNAMYVYCFKQYQQLLENNGSTNGSSQNSEWGGWITIQKVLPQAEFRLWKAWDSELGGFHSHYRAGKLAS